MYTYAFSIYTLCPFGVKSYSRYNQWTFNATSLDKSTPSSGFKFKDAQNCGVANNGAHVCKKICMLELFKQLVPSPNGRHENDLEINTLCPNSVRFNGRVCRAIRDADYWWNVIEVAFSYTGREQTEQRPWRREKYTRLCQCFGYASKS